MIERDLEKISDLTKLQADGLDQNIIESLGYEIFDKNGYSNYTENDTSITDDEDLEGSGSVSYMRKS